MRVELQNTNGTSRKFWRGEQVGCLVSVTWGRIGTSGQRQTKEFSTDLSARQWLRSKQREKLSRGYHNVGPDAGMECPRTAGPHAFSNVDRRRDSARDVLIYTQRCGLCRAERRIEVPASLAADVSGWRPTHPGDTPPRRDPLANMDHLRERTPPPARRSRRRPPARPSAPPPPPAPPVARRRFSEDD